LHPTPRSNTSGVYILLPVLNEVNNIGPLLDRIGNAMAGRSYTIGVLDDGSTDGTLDYLAERMRAPGHNLHLISRKKVTRGSQRGGALRLLLLWGLSNTTHGVFVEMDGDLSHRPEELLEGIRLIEENQADVAIASKYIGGGRTVNRPLGRRMVSRLCNLALRLLLSWRIRDYSNGFRFYSRAAADQVARTVIRYGSPIYLSEVLALWIRQDLRVKEFPTTYIGRNEGLSKLRVSDLVKAAIAAFEIATRFHFTGFATQEPACSAVDAAPASRSQGAGD
jgi:dolichol-phosphate mannosyltransferase